MSSGNFSMSAPAPPSASEAQSQDLVQHTFTAALELDRNIKSFFDLREKLGEGQYGKVYKAIERSTGERWACKQLAIQKMLVSGASDEEVTVPPSRPNLRVSIRSGEDS